MPDFSTRYYIEEKETVQDDIKKENEAKDNKKKKIIKKYVKKSIKDVFQRLENGWISTFQARSILEKLEEWYIDNYPHERKKIKLFFKEAINKVKNWEDRVYHDFER